MKKTAAIMLIALSLLLCSCNKENNMPDDDNYLPDTQINEDSQTEATQKEDEAVYVSFAKTYSTVSDYRYEFYDGMLESLSSINDDSQMYVDVYHAMDGEASFVYISTLGTGSDAIIENALKSGGYTDIAVNKISDGEFEIDVKECVSTQADDAQAYVNGKFTLVYDGILQKFALTHTNENGKNEKFDALRTENGYIAQYLSTENYERYVLSDNGEAKMLICDKENYAEDLSSVKDGFDAVEYIAIYELNSEKFHSIYKGVEYTYPRAEKEVTVG